MSGKKITAVVVTYNRVELLKECITALVAQKDLSGIIIVNNASTDETKLYLDNLQQGLDIKIHPLHSEINSGGAGGFHIGLKHAVELGYDYAWIMDDDAIPSSDSLAALIEAAITLKNDFGFLASSVFDETGCCMNTPTIDYKPNVTGYADWASKLDVGFLKISAATFVSVFIKTTVIKEVGLPIKEMFIWGDDSEYTGRISNIYPSYFVADSKVIHKRVLKSSISIFNETSDVRLNWYKLLYRNNGYRIRKHNGNKTYIKFIMLNFIELLRVAFKAENKKTTRMRVMFLGLVNSLFFNPTIKYPNDRD